MTKGEMIQELAAAERLYGQWDELAVALGRPFCSPAWMLAWWRHAAPPGAQLRIGAAFQGGELVGIAPFFAERTVAGLVRVRLLGSGNSSHVEPLARPGSERDVTSVVARLLTQATPPPDVMTFEAISINSGWSALFRDVWPARYRPWLRRTKSMPAPALTLAGRSYDEWFSGLSSRFRKDIRRLRRRLQDRGAVYRLASTEESLAKALRSFATLHYARWEAKGGSGALNPGIEQMLTEAAQRLGDARFRVWTIEVQDQIISSQIFVGAGGALSYWLGGFDDAWGAFGPSNQTIHAAIEHAWKVGDTRIDLGAGGQDYKYRFADDEEELEWVDLVPRTPRFPWVRLQLAPDHLRQATMHYRHALFRRLSPEAKRRVKNALARIRR